MHDHDTEQTYTVSREYRDGGTWTRTGDHDEEYDDLDEAIAAAKDESGDYGTGEFRAKVTDEDGDCVYCHEWRIDPNQEILEEATWLIEDEGEYQTEYWGIGEDGRYLHTVQNGGSRGAHSRQEGDGRWNQMADEIDEIEITDLVEALQKHEHSTTTIDAIEKIADEHPTNDLDDILSAFGKAAEARLTYEAETEEDWEDYCGEPECRTTTTVTLYMDRRKILAGEAIGYYRQCCSGGEQFSRWQDPEGPECDTEWDQIATILAAAGLIADEYDLRSCIDAPDEPAEPEEDEDGEYVLLFHGWEQPWTVRARYATDEDAARAARLAHRATTEANSQGAYGWEYAVAAIAEDGELEVNGLTLTMLDEE